MKREDEGKEEEGEGIYRNTGKDWGRILKLRKNELGRVRKQRERRDEEGREGGGREGGMGLDYSQWNSGRPL